MGLATQTFDVLTRIAIGNGSLVYKAVDKASLRQVALKLLTKDEELDHYFDVEALLAAAPQIRQITGSHVCQLLDAYEDEDGPLLVYEYANGISGSDVPRKLNFDAAQAIDVAAQLMSALRSGERQRTPHGDLKPSNVIFVDTPEGRPFTFVLDWGMAAFRTELTKDSMPYLAPERLAGGPVSHQADLFSAGALLFYLLTGKVLATGKDEEEVKVSWARAKPELLAELRPDLPAKFIQWLAWLLTFDVQKRPGSAVDAASALGMLNPPGPMVPPENIRPRPLSASQRAQAMGRTSGVFSASGSRIASPPGSGISQAPSSGTRMVPAQTALSASTSGRGADGRLNVSTAKKRPVAMLVISLTVAAAVAGTGVWWYNRDARIPTPVASTNSASRTIQASPGSLAGAAVAAKPSEKQKKRPAEKPQEPSEKPLEKVAATASALTKDKPSGGAEKHKPPAPKPPGPKAVTVKLMDASVAPPPPPLPPMAEEPPATPVKSPPTPGARPEVFVQESFAYVDAAELAGQKEGRGWVGAWQGEGAAIRNASLEYALHPKSGGTLVIPPSKETVTISRTVGPTSRLFEDQKNTRHWYFSALIAHSDRSPAAGGEVRIYPLDPTATGTSFYIGIADVGTTLRISMSGAPAPLMLPNMNKPMLLVCRFDASEPKAGKWDFLASLLVNPNLAAAGFKQAGAPLVATVKNAAMPPQSGVSIRKDAGAATTEMDEIRYGHHWTEMSFKPAPPTPSTPTVIKAAAK